MRGCGYVEQWASERDAEAKALGANAVAGRSIAAAVSAAAVRYLAFAASLVCRAWLG